MRKKILLLFMFSFFSKIASADSGTAYDYEFNGIDWESY